MSAPAISATAPGSSKSNFRPSNCASKRRTARQPSSALEMKRFNLAAIGILLCAVAARVAIAQPASAPAPATPAPAVPAPTATPAEFAASLALRTDRIVADSTRPVYGWLSQTSPVAFTSKGALQLKVVLAPWEGEVKPLKELANVTVYGGNLGSTPASFITDVRGVADGFYRCVGELVDGDTTIAKF